jgi:DNA modification methylase
MVEVFRGVRRVLRDDGTLWLNMGDSYASNPASGGPQSEKLNGPQNATPNRPGWTRPVGLKPKDLVGMPWRLAFVLQADGWYLRSDIIWAKPNPMPESVTDRPTKSHEHVFLLTKAARYFYDAHAVREAEKAPGASAKVIEYQLRRQRDLGDYGDNKTASTRKWKGDGDTYHGGRNLRDVWTIPTEAYTEAHFATFPRKLVAPCLKAGTSAKGCCPECGAPWVRVVKSDRKPTRPGRDNVTDETGMANRDSGRHVTEYGTIGWGAGCKCKAGHSLSASIPVIAPVPCVAFDPFAGSGTVGVVAKQLGLDFIGIELNADYCEMARKRIENPEPEAAIPDVPGQLVFKGVSDEPDPNRA